VANAVRMVDKSQFDDAKDELMDGMRTNLNCITALLLMRFLRLDYPRAFGATDISPDEMLARAQKAPAEERERANKFREYISSELSDSRTALFLCGSVAEKVNNDMKEALHYYILSAELGCAAAQFNLGCFYSSGIGTDVDKAEAAKWFQLASDQGRANAQNNLGVLYLTGQGVPQDRKKAAELFKAAAKQGHASAKQNYLIAARPVTPLKLPMAQGSIPSDPIVSPREEVEPWDPKGNGNGEDVPLTGSSGRKRRTSFSIRFFGNK